MNKAILVLFCSLNLSISYGQSDSAYYSLFKKQNLAYELAGHSRSLFSINYERSICNFKNTFFIALRTGGGITPPITINEKKQKPIYCVPVVASLYAGKKHHYLSFGVGYNASFGYNATDSSTNPPTIYQSFESAFIVRMGYRYCDKSGFIVEAYPILQWTNNPSNDFAVGFGLAFGYSYNNLFKAIKGEE